MPQRRENSVISILPLLLLAVQALKVDLYAVSQGSPTRVTASLTLEADERILHCTYVSGTSITVGYIGRKSGETGVVVWEKDKQRRKFEFTAPDLATVPYEFDGRLRFALIRDSNQAFRSGDDIFVTKELDCIDSSKDKEPARESYSALCQRLHPTGSKLLQEVDSGSGSFGEGLPVDHRIRTYKAPYEVNIRPALVGLAQSILVNEADDVLLIVWHGANQVTRAVRSKSVGEKQYHLSKFDLELAKSVLVVSAAWESDRRIWINTFSQKERRYRAIPLDFMSDGGFILDDRSGIDGFVCSSQ